MGLDQVEQLVAVGLGEMGGDIHGGGLEVVGWAILELIGWHTAGSVGPQP